MKPMSVGRTVKKTVRYAYTRLKTRLLNKREFIQMTVMQSLRAEEWQEVIQTQKGKWWQCFCPFSTTNNGHPKGFPSSFQCTKEKTSFSLFFSLVFTFSVLNSGVINSFPYGYKPKMAHLFFSRARDWDYAHSVILLITAINFGRKRPESRFSNSRSKKQDLLCLTKGINHLWFEKKNCSHAK